MSIENRIEVRCTPGERPQAFIPGECLNDIHTVDSDFLISECYVHYLFPTRWFVIPR